MHIKPEIGSVTGPTSDTHWGQVLTMPGAYGVVEIEDPSGRARELGISVLTKLSELLNTPPTSLDDVQKITSSVGSSAIASLIICIPVGLVVYIVIAGNGAVFMKRGNSIAELLSGPGAISGQIAAQDTLLLVSQSFTRALTQADFAGAFDHLSAQDVAEKLTLLLHESTRGEGSAGLVFQIVDTEPVEEEEPPKEARTIARRKPWENIWALQRMRRVRAKIPKLETRKSKVLAVMTAVLFLLFGTSVLLGIVKEGFGRTNKEAGAAFVDAQHAYEEGVALMDLNPVKGRERLTQAKTMLEPFTKSVPSRSKQGREIANLYKQILDNLTQAMHSIKGEPKLFYDAGLLKKGSLVSEIAIEDDTIAMVDATLSTIYTLSVPTKSGAIIAGGTAFSGARLVTVHGDAVYVFTNNGIHKIDTSSHTVTESVVKKDETWGTISDIFSFGGNLYLLDTARGRIWKYVATDAGFSDRREYLNPDTLPDLSHTAGMVIDGSVFLGTSVGKIFRFTQGRENTFTPSGVEPKFGSTLLVWTSDTAKNIYVLDKENKRVVTLDKDGNYIAQYTWESALTPTQLVVSEKSGKILLLADGKLYSLDLQ